MLYIDIIDIIDSLMRACTAQLAPVGGLTVLEQAPWA